MSREIAFTHTKKHLQQPQSTANRLEVVEGRWKERSYIQHKTPNHCRCQRQILTDHGRSFSSNSLSIGSVVPTFQESPDGQLPRNTAAKRKWHFR